MQKTSEPSKRAARRNAAALMILTFGALNEDGADAEGKGSDVDKSVAELAEASFGTEGVRGLWPEGSAEDVCDNGPPRGRKLSIWRFAQSTDGL